MSKKTLKIDPLDTLFFRDAKPFSMGEDNTADTVNFPPAPSVFYGALCTLLASHNGWALDEIAEKTAELKITALYLERDSKQYLPCPADCVAIKGANLKGGYLESKKMQRLGFNSYSKSIKGSEIDSFTSSNQETTTALFAPKPDTFVESVPNAKCSTNELMNYLYNSSIPDLVILNPIIEPKIGLMIDRKSNTASEGNLYRIDQLRLPESDSKQAWKICLEFEDVNNYKLPEKGFIKLGGEGKVASYNLSIDSDFTKNLDLDDLKEESSSSFFLMYLATPALLEDAWRPQLSRLGLAENDVKLHSACLGKAEYIGGFNMQKTAKQPKGPKPMYKAVPAGSVYIYEIQNVAKKDNIWALLQKNQGASISDIDEDKSKQGFGIAYFGII